MLKSIILWPILLHTCRTCCHSAPKCWMPCKQTGCWSRWNSLMALMASRASNCPTALMGCTAERDSLSGSRRISVSLEIGHGQQDMLVEHAAPTLWRVGVNFQRLWPLHNYMQFIPNALGPALFFGQVLPRRPGYRVTCWVGKESTFSACDRSDQWMKAAVYLFIECMWVWRGWQVAKKRWPRKRKNRTS